MMRAVGALAVAMAVVNCEFERWPGKRVTSDKTKQVCGSACLNYTYTFLACYLLCDQPQGQGVRYFDATDNGPPNNVDVRLLKCSCSQIKTIPQITNGCSGGNPPLPVDF